MVVYQPSRHVQPDQSCYCEMFPFYRSVSYFISLASCDVEHNSFHFGLCGRKFCACLVSVQVCIICHSWQHTGVVHMSLQADGKVAFEDISLCLTYAAQPAMILHCISLSWFFSSRLVLSQVHVSFNIFCQHIVHVQLAVVYNHHLYLCDVHLKTHSSTFII